MGTMETTTRAIFDLQEVMDEQQAGAQNLVTRETGRLIRESVEPCLKREPKGSAHRLGQPGRWCMAIIGDVAPVS
jgi:hypothetical protein